MYKKDDYTGDNINIKEIVERYYKPKNKYLFPLHQAHSTPKQLLQSIKMLVCLFLKLSTSKLASDSNYILVNMWSDLAMNCGASSTEIAGCISHTGVSNALTFCVQPSDLDPDKVSQIRNRVIEALRDNPVHWYAMHLRRQIGLKDLTDRLNEKKIVLDEIFYPMEEIFHKVGKKVTFEKRPVISWLVFYRARVTQLNKLFHEIGDIAWGYHYLRDVKSPYAIIPSNEVREYQQAIGTLSPSTQMVSDDEIEFKNGDYLVVLGGPLNARHGIFISEKKERGDVTGRVVFRISLAGGNNVNWEVNWDPRLVKKISEDKYRELDNQLQNILRQD